jgi:NADH dehydrogenase
VEDLADLAISCGQEESNLVLDAVGPEIFAFEDLVKQIATAFCAKPKLIHVCPSTALQMLRLVGPIVGDVVLTREEIEGLMANLLVSKRRATGQTRFSAWLPKNANALGTRYNSELKRHYQ